MVISKNNLIFADPHLHVCQEMNSRFFLLIAGRGRYMRQPTDTASNDMALVEPESRLRCGGLVTANN